MKIDYKILWLDDNINTFKNDDIVKDIEDFLQEQGFQPIIITESKPEKFFKSLDDTFDLILTDYHLSGVNGDEIIRQIRARSIMTEILFYTAKADLTDTHKIDRVSFLETTKSTENHIDAVYNKVIELIELTIKKFQNIVAMRGMIMNETSSLDNEMVSIINKALDNEQIKFNELSIVIYDKLIKFFERKRNFVEKCKKNSKFKKLIEDNVVFSAEYKIMTLSKILEELGMIDFSADYKSEIINIRNKFAHALLERDINGKEFFKDNRGGISFDEILCKKIRKDIVKHKRNLDELNKRI